MFKLHIFFIIFLSVILNANTSLSQKHLEISLSSTQLILFVIFILSIIVFVIYLLNKKNTIIKKKLKKKKKELQLFQSIVDNVKVGVSISKVNSEDLLIDYVNKEFSHMTGYAQDEVIGKNLRLLQNNDKKQKSIKTLRKSINNKKECQVELRNYKKDGTLFINLLSLTPIFDTEKNFLYYIGIQQDITELQLQKQQLEHQSKLASMGEMIGNISHQWRQPLSVISTGATGMIMQKEYDKLDDESFFNTCRNINKNAQYLSQTIDDFRNFIKGDTKSVRFDLKNDTDNFIKLVDSTIKKYNIKIILELEEDLSVVGYPNELIQCFINIFNNSKDALLHNNIPENERYILISQKVVDKTIIINFKDNAGGIPEDIIDKIFEPYFTTKHQSQGTGLGLHMSYNLITKGMKGKIKVKNQTYTIQNKTYKGASFDIKIPIDNNDDKDKS